MHTRIEDLDDRVKFMDEGPVVAELHVDAAGLHFIHEALIEKAPDDLYAREIGKVVERAKEIVWRREVG